MSSSMDMCDRVRGRDVSRSLVGGTKKAFDVSAMESSNTEASTVSFIVVSLVWSGVV